MGILGQLLAYSAVSGELFTSKDLRIAKQKRLNMAAASLKADGGGEQVEPPAQAAWH